MAVTITIPYKPREHFKAYHATLKRYRVLDCHRRYGKTVGIVNHLIRQATTDPAILAQSRGLQLSQEAIDRYRVSPRTFSYIAPYLKQAKAIAWEPLKFYAGRIPGVVFNESELRADLPGFGRVRLFGADNIEALRGMEMWESVLDEYQDQLPDWWKTVLSPTGLATKAPLTFAGTNKGSDHLYQLIEAHKDDPSWFSLYLPASVTGIYSEEDLANERALIGDSKYRQEYELDPFANIDGAIFGEEMKWLRDNKHIRDLPVEEFVPVNTYWDLGINDYMVVLMTQETAFDTRIIDCRSYVGMSLTEVAKDLRSSNYMFGTHYLPHDGRIRDLQTGMTRQTALQSLITGQVEVLPRTPTKEDAIDSFRSQYKKIYIDSKLKNYTNALEHYCREYDEKGRVYMAAPKHDWTSHFADATLGLTQRMRLTLLQNNINHACLVPEPHFVDEGGLII